jgi:hypothetical protein
MDDMLLLRFIFRMFDLVDSAGGLYGDGVQDV